MVDIKIDKGEAKICLDGEALQVYFEVSQIGKCLADRNKEVAKNLVFGMCEHISKEEMIATVENAFKAYEYGDMVTNALDEKGLDKSLEELVKNIFGGKKDE